MAFDAISALRDAGTPVDQLTDAQRGALSTLTPAEVGVITDVQNRIADAADDVEGHSVVGIGVF
jgi:hypothetical protein